VRSPLKLFNRLKKWLVTEQDGKKVAVTIIWTTTGIGAIVLGFRIASFFMKWVYFSAFPNCFDSSLIIYAGLICIYAAYREMRS